ncbi:MAG: VWA domain-containing protein [Planctomycetota bacterium]|nr:VWA domain-containing protein [Planctomycetota bacterium]
MSDWRNGNNKDSGGRKENRPKSKPIIPSVSNPKNPSPAPSGASSDWRTNSKKRVVSNKPEDKSWTGRGREKTTSTTALSKAILLAGVGLVVSSLFYVLCVQLLKREPRLPVVVGISTDYSSMDLAASSFGVQSFDLKEDQLHLFPSDQKSSKGDPLKLAGNEAFLNAIRKEEEWVPRGQDWEKITIFQDRQRRNLVGGGPSGKVTAYFISCLIAREGVPEVTSVSGTDSEKTSWKLLTKDDSPFRESKNPLSIKTVLQRIARQTAKGSYAYVALDVKPPPVVTNLGDLEFPFDDLKRAFEDLENDEKQRLIVCLPCSKGEESWTAPEYSCSVFAHFFWQGITTGFDGSKMSISEFQRGIEGKVTNWVAERRFAKQTPQCLALPETETQMKKVMFVETSGGELKPQGVPAFDSVLPKRCDTLDKLWDEYERLRHCVYTNPLRFATVESGLIQMEDLAEYASPQAWKDFEDGINKHFDDLKKLTKFERRVSLVEAEQHQIFLGNSSVSSDLKDQKCLGTWKSLLKATEYGGIQGFSEKELEEAINNCNDPERAPVEWIEVRLLKLMHEAIRAIDENSAEQTDAGKTIARLLKMYSDLNGIAFDPRSELSHWTGKRVVEMDKHFAEGFDYFFANDFKTCREKLESMQPDLANLSADFNILKEAMIARDEALWLTPHLIAAQMRMSRLPRYQENKEVSEIANLLQAAILLCNSLEDHQKDVGKLNLMPEKVTEQLKQLKGSLDRAFLDASTKQEGDAHALPMTRIALRWPLLEKGLRKKLHDRLVKFYAKGNKKSDSSSKVDDEWSKVTPSDVGREFWSLSALQDNKTIGSLYERMIKNDARYAFSGKKMEADTDRIDGSMPAKQRIYRESCQMRMFANSIGQLALEDPSKQKSWPLNAPDQLQAVNEVVYNHVQSERLCTTRWGDGDLDSKKQLYFERMLSESSKPFNADPALALIDYPQAQSIPKELEKSSEEFLKIACKQVKDLRVEAGRLDPSQAARVSIEIGKNEWPVLATLSVHDDSPIGSRLPFSELQKANSQGQKLSQEDTKVPLRLDPNRVGSELRLGVRGHYKSSSLQSDTAVKKFKIAQESLLGPTKLRIKANDNKAIKLWVLLDCSYSMKKKNLHDEATGTAKQLLEQVMKQNDDGESPIDVGFIVFGHRSNDDKFPLPSELKPCEIGNQIFKSAIMKGKQIGDLVSLLKDPWIRPSGCTPLYDAIYTACEASENDGRSWIVVISDGSNDVYKVPPGMKKGDDGYYGYYDSRIGNKNDEDVRKKVIEKNCNLFVFQFLNDAYYKEEKDSNGEPFSLSKIREIADSNTELKTLLSKLPPKNPGTAKSKIFYENVKELADDLISLLPVSKITMADQDGSKLGSEPFFRFGKQISLPIPEPMEVTITVDSREKVSKFPIWLTGGEKLEFKYSDSGKLTMTPYKEDVASSVKTSKLMSDESGKESLVGARAAIAAVEQDPLDLQLVLQSDLNEWADHTKLIRRPRFVVAAVTPAGIQKETFWVCDHSFVPETHYPNIQLPYIPWKKEDNQFRSEKVDLKVWISAEVPPKAVTFRMKKNDEAQVIKDLELLCERVMDVITVTLPASPPESMGRHLVMCSTATKTTRHYVGEYSDGREVRIEFEVPSDKEAEICIFKVSELEAWRNSGTVQRYDVQGLEFK